MITVDDVLKEGKTAKTVNAVDESSELKPQKKSYWPAIIISAAIAIAGLVYLHKKGQTNGDIPV
jgi:hypothetical protein